MLCAMNILVIGGAGYIGSHCVRLLQEAGHRPVVLDNLVFGHRASVPESVTLAEGDLGDRALVAELLRREEIALVMHFAAFAYVGESVSDPLKYYDNNVARTIALLEAMRDAGVGRFVFSSSCATYGVPERLPITEDLPQQPISPYGRTKLAVEQILGDCARAHGLSSASFRYFNAAGAAPDGSIGEDHEPETHLIPLAIRAATGTGPELRIFGTDYATPDGTCLRDYVHVDDLSRAHIAVFDRLEKPGQTLAYNLGTGRPCSVREVIATVGTVTGKHVPVREADRRPGDPSELYADATRARSELDWIPGFADITGIVETAWRWHRNHPQGYRD